MLMHREMSGAGEMPDAFIPLTACLSRVLGTHRGAYMGSALCSVLLGGAEGVIHPLLMRAIFDSAASRSDFQHFIGLVLEYMVLGIFLNTGNYFVSLWQQRVDDRVVVSLSTRLLRAFYSVDYAEILKSGSGSYVSRMRLDVKEGVVPLLTLMRSIAMRTATFVALVSVLIVMSWKAFIALAALIPVATVVSIRVGRRIRDLASKEREGEASLVNALTKSVDAFKIVCGFSLTTKALENFSSKLNHVTAAGYSRVRLIKRLQGVSDLTMVGSDVCSIMVGAFLVFQKQMSFGTFIAFMNAFWRSATTLIQVFREWAELHSHVATAGRVVAFLQRDIDPCSNRSGVHLVATSVGFRYGIESVITGFSMRLEPGERVLVVGANGSGKTTLANLLAGHLHPTEGSLELPERISAVTLPAIFPPLPVKQLCLDKEIMATLGIDGLDIMDGYPDQLSAGQQQKLSLALALSQEADLYILDEPLANLDVASRALAMGLVRSRTKGRSLVVIMHGVNEYQGMFDRIHTLRGPRDDAISCDLKAVLDPGLDAGSLA